MKLFKKDKNKNKEEEVEEKIEKDIKYAKDILRCPGKGCRSIDIIVNFKYTDDIVFYKCNDCQLVFSVNTLK